MMLGSKPYTCIESSCLFSLPTGFEQSVAEEISQNQAESINYESMVSSSSSLTTDDLKNTSQIKEKGGSILDLSYSAYSLPT